jgi:Sec-independent protein translocase protein TatA
LITIINIRGGEVQTPSLPLSARGAYMHTAGSFLLLFIFVVLIFGVPILLLAVRLIETISEWRESMSRAEGESTSDEKAAFEKRSTDDAREWTPAKHMR